LTTVAESQIERLVLKLIAAVPKLERDEQRDALTLLRTLGGGDPVSAQRLAVAMHAREDDVEAIVRSWPGVFRDDHERVSGYMGLSVVELGEHRIDVNGRTLSAWCAWDTLFLPELLGREAAIRSRCPTTDKAISLTVGPDGPVDVRPAETVLSFVAPEQQFDADVVRSFCHFVHFFASEKAAQEWTEQHPGTFTVSIDQGFQLGQLTNRATFGAALNNDRAPGLRSPMRAR
jgi:alkylmercury lyase